MLELYSSNSESAEKITTRLQAKAQGVFLWVRLVIKSLLRGLRNRDGIDLLLDRIEQHPDDIYNLYSYLWQRNTSDAKLYVKTTALYYQLVDLKVRGLIDFYFATDHDLRARYLDAEQILSCPAEEVGAEIDLELLSTRINVCSAGMLEVVDGSISTPQPSELSTMTPMQGLVAKYYRHTIDFIHRTAYQYVFDTQEGQNLLTSSELSHEELQQIKREVTLLTSTIIPGLCGYKIDGRALERVMSDIGEVTDSGEQQSEIQQLEEICNILLRRGLLIKQTNGASMMFYPHCDPFPISVSQLVDLCPWLVAAFQYDLAEPHLLRHGHHQDPAYLSRLLSCITYDWLPWESSAYDPTEVSLPLPDKFIALMCLGADINRVEFTNDGEERCAVIEIVVKLFQLQAHMNIDPALEALVDNGADFSIGVPPTCLTFLDSLDTDFSSCCLVFGKFTAHDLIFLSKRDSVETSLSNSRVDVLVVRNRDFDSIYAINANTSGAVLDLLRSARAEHKERMSFICRPGTVVLGFDFYLTPEIESQSRRLPSLADALRYMGKTETAIQNSAQIHMQWLKASRYESSGLGYERLFSDSTIDSWERRLWGITNKRSAVGVIQSPLCSEDEEISMRPRFTTRKRKREDEASGEESSEL